MQANSIPLKTRLDPPTGLPVHVLRPKIKRPRIPARPFPMRIPRKNHSSGYLRFLNSR